MCALDFIFDRHQQWIDVLESLKIALTDLIQQIGRIRGQTGRFVGKLRIKVLQAEVIANEGFVRLKSWFI